MAYNFTITESGRCSRCGLAISCEVLIPIGLHGQKLREDFMERHDLAHEVEYVLSAMKRKHAGASKK